MCPIKKGIVMMLRKIILRGLFSILQILTYFIYIWCSGKLNQTNLFFKQVFCKNRGDDSLKNPK